MKLLLHACCAICAIGSLEGLKQEIYEPVAFFFNPNIHPYREFTLRLEACREYFPARQIPLVENPAYRLEEFLTGALEAGQERCRFCYRLRLEETARQAAELEIPAFSTTLLLSPYQNREWIREEGERAAALYGREFVFRDWREHFRTAQDKSRELGLYRQKYCGCVFSERDRFAKK